MLPRVDLTAADEEALFGLTVRFQYAESELEVITVLQELAFCTVLDVLPAALLQRTTLLDTVLETMTSASASDTARHLATHFLHSLVIQTKQALLQADDPEQCPLYDGANATASCLHPKALHAAFHGRATDVAAPSCPHTTCRLKLCIVNKSTF